jgi:hypothetical protein
MIAYLNDWSFANGKGVVENWGKILLFADLMKELAQKCGVEVHAPSNLWQIPLAGLNVTTGVTAIENDKRLTTENKNYLRSIFHKIHGDVVGLPYFSEKNDMSNPSPSMGRAVTENIPALSFCFDDRYAKGSIDGWQQGEDGDISKGIVVNIFDKKSENYRFFADLTVVTHMNPLITPLWNTELTKEVMKDVNFVNVDIKRRQSMLQDYGRKVAEMNGWCYDEKITKLNQNAGQLRYIFSSTDHFTGYPTAYLSIDMEGPDLGFELCDKNGDHKGEYSWDGGNKPPKNHHGIRVK